MNWPGSAWKNQGSHSYSAGSAVIYCVVADHQQVFGSDVDCLTYGKKYFRIGFDIAQFGGSECVINTPRNAETAQNWFKIEGDIGNNCGGDSLCT